MRKLESDASTAAGGDLSTRMGDQAIGEGDRLEAELVRLRGENRRRLRRRVSVILIVLLTAAGVQWHRQIGLWVTSRWWVAKAGGPTVDVSTALHQIETSDTLVVDVRDPEEFLVSHLEGARSLPLAELESSGWPPDWRRDRPVIVYCTVGYRSGLAARYLQEQGFDAKNLVGGILALAQADQPLVDGSGQTWRVHTWHESFAWLVPAPYEAAWVPLTGLQGAGGRSPGRHD
jgi:rhodanese-related sulfurtransferase